MGLNREITLPLGSVNLFFKYFVIYTGYARQIDRLIWGMSIWVIDRSHRATAVLAEGISLPRLVSPAFRARK